MVWPNLREMALSPLPTFARPSIVVRGSPYILFAGAFSFVTLCHSPSQHCQLRRQLPRSKVSSAQTFFEQKGSHFLRKLSFSLSLNLRYIIVCQLKLVHICLILDDSICLAWIQNRCMGQASCRHTSSSRFLKGQAPLAALIDRTSTHAYIV